MSTADDSHLFAYSRNPLEFLDRDPSSVNPQWFVTRGLRTLKAFIRKLQVHPRVTEASMGVQERHFTDVAGRAHVFQVNLKLAYGDKTPIGVRAFGHSPVRVEARTAAVAEALERMALTGIPGHRPAGSLIRPASRERTTNGACFHSLPDRVLLGGICELLERDALLCNWYSDVGLPVSRIGTEHHLHSTKRNLAEIGWELQEHVWRHDKVAAYCVMVSLSRTEPADDEWNFFIGGASRPSYQEASRNALTESLFMARTWQRAFDSVDTTSDAPVNLLSSPEYRLFLCQRPQYVAEFRARLQKPRIPPKAKRTLSEDRFIRAAFKAMPTLTVIPLPLPLPFADKVFCVKMECAELQSIDWQVPPGYNLQRIRERYNTPRGRLNTMLHPFS